jgi:hypothetical protein
MQQIQTLVFTKDVLFTETRRNKVANILSWTANELIWDNKHGGHPFSLKQVHINIVTAYNTGPNRKETTIANIT